MWNEELTIERAVAAAFEAGDDGLIQPSKGAPLPQRDGAGVMIPNQIGRAAGRGKR